MSALPDLKVLPFGGAGAVDDPAQRQALADIKIDFSKILNDTTITQRFVDRYQQWIASTKNNTILGIDKFSFACYANATTEVFDKFYLRNNSRRFRCFRGEYMYHILSWRNCFPNWCYIDQDEIQSNDAVVISLPFADTGGKNQQMNDILDRCESLNVPVLIDCAYLGICSDLIIDLTRSCITDVTFSLSKSFPIAHARIGMRLTRIDDDDPLFVLNKTNYTNRIGAAIGLEMIENFGPDYIPDTYRELQHKWCQQLGAEVSPTVIFGLGDSQWKQYDRGAGNHRLCFHRYLGLRQLSNDIS